MSFLNRVLRTAVAAAVFLTLFVITASAACIGVGTVNVSGLHLRSEANTDSSILATAPEGDHAIVLEDVGNGWYKVDYRTVEGYMSAEYLDVAAQADVDLGCGVVDTDGSTLNVRSGPDTDHERTASLDSGTVVSILGVDNGWFKISLGDITGYVSSDYMVTCKDETGARGDDPSALAASSLGQQIAEYAKKFLGTPYVWGGNGPNGFDCSGFTKYIYSQFGYTLNRTASGQLENGVSVSRSELQPGDLVFFYDGKVSTPVSHVGIYIGGDEFIHASTNDYQVKINSLNASNYNHKYVYARRII